MMILKIRFLRGRIVCSLQTRRQFYFSIIFTYNKKYLQISCLEITSFFFSRKIISGGVKLGLDLKLNLK